MIYHMNAGEANKARKCAKTLEPIIASKDVVFNPGDTIEVEVFDDKGKYLHSLKIQKVK